MANRTELTEAQELALGHIVADYIGGHFQSGHVVDEDAEPGTVYLYAQLGPNHPLRGHHIAPDGTVTFND